MKIVFATNNAHKLEELRQIAKNDLEILGLKDIGCDVDIPETGNSLEANALQKARYIHEHFGVNCFADDTGLEVDALNGAPGVMSARYAGGEGHDSQANMKLLLKNLSGVTDRKARFRTVIALIIDDKEYTFEGIVNGTIISEPQGKEGFGYDPIFQPTDWKKTFAEASAEEKNAISHRGRAVRKLMDFLSSTIQ